MRIAFVGDSLTRGIPGCSYLGMMRARRPDDTLINLGKGNDTAISLYQRVKRIRFEKSFDMAFLWVGVNDVSERNTLLVRFVNALRGQPRSKSVDEFKRYYRLSLERLCRHAARVIAVSPFLKGEDLDNNWNRQLSILSGVIEELASCDDQVTYLDLRSRVAQRLDGKQVVRHVPIGTARVVLDALTLRTREQVDRQAAVRGYHFTLDGVHLNGAGAELAAEAFLRIIVDKERERREGAKV